MSDSIGQYVDEVVLNAPPLSLHQELRLRAIFGTPGSLHPTPARTPEPPTEPRIDYRFSARVADALGACAICGTPIQVHHMLDHKFESLTYPEAAQVLRKIAEKLA